MAQDVYSGGGTEGVEGPWGKGEGVDGEVWPRPRILAFALTRAYFRQESSGGRDLGIRKGAPIVFGENRDMGADGVRKDDKKMKSNMGCPGEMSKEMAAAVKIMLMLEGFSGRKAAEILTGVLVSIIGATANKGKEREIVDAVIKELKDGVELMKNVKPIGVVVMDVMGQLKKGHGQSLN